MAMESADTQPRANGLLRVAGGLAQLIGAVLVAVPGVYVVANLPGILVALLFGLAALVVPPVGVGIVLITRGRRLARGLSRVSTGIWATVTGFVLLAIGTHARTWTAMTPWERRVFELVPLVFAALAAVCLLIPVLIAAGSDGTHRTRDARTRATPWRWIVLAIVCAAAIATAVSLPGKG